MSAANPVRLLSAHEAKASLFSPIEAERERNVGIEVNTGDPANYSKRLEARVGIEPTYKGFADLSLTTWVPRPIL